MFNSLLLNRQVMSLMAQNDDIFLFTQNEWCIIDSLCSILAALHGATLQIERRSTSISSYIPICKTIITNFEAGFSAAPLDFNLFKKTVAAALKNRIKGWEDKRYNVEFYHEFNRNFKLFNIGHPAGPSL
jgi:hypothetical protein